MFKPQQIRLSIFDDQFLKRQHAGIWRMSFFFFFSPENVKLRLTRAQTHTVSHSVFPPSILFKKKKKKKSETQEMLCHN